ncbi:MAG: hypothetical protein K6T66_03345 [Peptococcaceae bacterium]|nr:hypothetical protein [Peptococcaceae bacterium]
MRVFRAYGMNDLRMVSRDSLLLYMVLLPWLLVLLLRLITPDITARLASGYDFRLEPYYPLILSFFIVLQMPMVFGVVFGLLMLDDRDDGILTALQATPASALSYLYYRISAAIILSVVFILVSLPLTGLTPPSLLPRVAPVAPVSGLLSMVLAVFLAAFSGNKVEGLALMKGFGILMLGPLAGYFIPSGWQPVLGVLPSFWPAKAFWAAWAGEATWPYVTAGIVYNILLLYWLLRRFQAKLHR